MLKPVELNKEFESVSIHTLKTNITIWVIYATSEFKRTMEEELSKCISVKIEWLDLNEISGNGERRTPDVIYIEAGDNWAKKVANIYSNEGDIQNNQTALVVFGDEHDTTSLKLALKLGASDYFNHEVSFYELLPLLEDIAMDKASSNKLGELSLFINTKGGSGATTVALNTAIALSEYSKGKVLLIDLGMQFSDATDYLSSKPKYSINDVVDTMNDLDELSLEGLVHTHSSGVNYLCFSPENIKDNYDRATKVSELIPLLRHYYQHVIVDMSHGIEHVFQHIVSPASYIFLVMQQNVASIKHATNYIKSLQLDYGLSGDQVRLVINRYEKKNSITVKDIEKTLPNREMLLVPNNFSISMECSNLGKPIVQSKKNSAIKSSLIDISHHLEKPTEKDTKNWFGKLFS